MKKVILLLFLLTEAFFLSSFILDLGAPFSPYWMMLFLSGMVTALIFGLTHKGRNEALLAIAVLTFSVASIGGYIFNLYIRHSFA
ncbi:hypothetical protein [Pseudobacillus badius]|uniref:hypothetical protein n=1 Tax=Bacillus badius TaxID=1455 RepID=UPI0007B0B3C8|nr:hypothetical protein [Bacillus badius]KZN98252.1 hypothetical protein A4244_10885 [Bacillus badius]KZR58538.1 hypothetical protein A3781_16740 [Bacillus badius]OCS82575.1 hypothetical protein A6M11_10895 [Bacillus badius]OVE50765.1 hypothetical protein B1A98_15125 [Bacillus badius]TDW01389.1 hypothetical protein B0G66_11111 [Bacillus badius]